MARLVALLVLVLGAHMMLAPSAGATDAAGYVPISGSGSTWSSSALEQWRRGAGDRYSMPVSFSPDDSANGRYDFREGLVDFAVSEVPYGGSDGGVADPPPAWAFGYLPIVAGETAFMYNLKIGNKWVTNLRLSGETLAKIFTREITNWADPAIEADNPGLALPARNIVPVVRADAAGPTAQFTAYLASQYPSIWDSYCQRAGLQRTPCGPISIYPMIAGAHEGGMQARAGSPGVAGFVAQDSSEGSITYVEYSYARRAGFPVAKVLNAANYYVEPSAGNVAIALRNAALHPDLTQDLSGVYRDPDPRAYPLSSYGYMLVPKAETETFTAGKGHTLAEFARYALCDGQQQAVELGYAPLPVNLVQAALDQISQIPGASPQLADGGVRNCHNPALAADGTDLLGGIVPQPPACDFKTALAQCATSTGGATDPSAASGSAPAPPPSPAPAVVRPPVGARSTSATFMAIPSGPVIQGTPVILIAQVQPPGASGAVQFKDGNTELGLPRPVVGGLALTVTSKLAKGTHSLTAVFTAADPAAFGPSAPLPVSLTVIGLS